MVAILRGEWRPTMSWQELIELRDRLDDMLLRIRSKRDILPPMMYCPNCKSRHRATQPNVSVRALILSMGRFDITSGNEMRRLEKGWKKYRDEQKLDLYGREAAGAATAVNQTGCRPEKVRCCWK